MASAAVRSKTVILLLFILFLLLFPLFVSFCVFGPCFVMHYFVPFLALQLLYFFVLLISCGSYCFFPLSHRTAGLDYAQRVIVAFPGHTHFFRSFVFRQEDFKFTFRKSTLAYMT